jgi:hypothetical protein
MVLTKIGTSIKVLSLIELGRDIPFEDIFGHDCKEFEGLISAVYGIELDKVGADNALCDQISEDFLGVRMHIDMIKDRKGAFVAGGDLKE